VLKNKSALQALSIKALFDAANGNEVAQSPLIDQLKSLVGSKPEPSVHLTASQVLLASGQVKEALQCVHAGAIPEQVSMALQIYLKLNRLDLAQQQLEKLKRGDEDSILAQLGSVYINLAKGSTGAPDAVHSINSLSEQYGPSPYLLNLMACALMQQGDYVAAEQKLDECIREQGGETVLPDTLINMIGCHVQQNKSADAYVNQMKEQYPTHAFCAGLDRVVSAFDRESVKYKV
jgi:coatomer protein complex subunit epsilon